MTKVEKKRIQEVLRWLPAIRDIVRLGGKWKQLEAICRPLGICDTAFRDYPNLNDYLVNYSYWRHQLDDKIPFRRYKKLVFVKTRWDREKEKAARL